MNKCKWKKGLIDGSPEKYVKTGLIFHPCDNFEPTSNRNNKSVYCIYCDTDIRKPEPEKPLIVKSGETWVVHWEGVDYLCVKPRDWDDIQEMDEGLCTFSEILRKHPDGWKSFSEITLDDETAKLRPMVTCYKDTDIICKLLGIHGHRAVTLNNSDAFVGWGEYRLATAKELQEAA
ncbi:hypothetical protein KAR91_67520 [Candidatus Pacearchaeota archaeon]|nr:hypothetical protein [Candidatus Pacearchaeota archaeon]